MRLQAMLGNSEQATRNDLNMGGYMCLARIIKIHHKKNTADVRLVRTNDILMSIPENEGKFSCRIGVANAHYDPKTKKSSGVIEPLQEGQLVVVGYLDNLKSQPWILGSFHWTMDRLQNILPDKYPIEASDKREYAKYLRVFPSQDYLRMDGDGNLEFAMHGKSFLKIDENLSDDRNGTDFEDLFEKDKQTNKTRTMEDVKYHQPKDILFVQRNDWNDSSTKWTKLFLNKNGLLRFTRDNRDNSLLFMEMRDDGTWRLKRQLDSEKLDAGSISTEARLDKSGSFSILHNNNDKSTKLSIDSDGAWTVSKTGGTGSSSIGITSNDDIVINRDGINGAYSVAQISNSCDITLTAGSKNGSCTIILGTDGSININSKQSFTLHSDEAVHIKGRKIILESDDDTLVV